MSLAALRLSRALWARRLAYRRARLTAAQAARDGGRIVKWKSLVADALARVAHRDVQIAGLTRPTGVSPAGVQMIAAFEGGQSPDGLFRPYRDPVGVWTVGYGHTENVWSGSRPLTKRQALNLLRVDLDRKYTPAVLRLGLPLTQPMLDALVSFVYNLGPGIVQPGHTIGDALARHDWHGVAAAILLYDKAGNPPRALPGLTVRRRAEHDLWEKGRKEIR